MSIAASELNVTIEIDPAVMGAQTDGLNDCDHVTGTIHYPDGTTGTLVYGKALVTAGSPWDVRAYGTKDPQFPVHPTTDQLFSGETFDAYQALGRCVGRACAAEVPGPPDEAAPEAVAPAVARAAAPEAAAVHAPGDRSPAPPLSGVTDVRVRDVETATAELT